MTIKVITPPAYEPVTVADAKAWMTIDSDDASFDAIVALLVQAMREDAENLTHRAFIQRSLRLYMDRWPVTPDTGNAIVLPQPPLVSVTSVKYTDTNGVLQTLDPAQYVVHDWKEPAIIVPAWNAVWPTIRIVPDSIQVDYVAGYPSGSPQDADGARQLLPAKLKLWMEAKAATVFMNREQIMSTGLMAMPRDFTDGLLDSLVIGTRLF